MVSYFESTNLHEVKKRRFLDRDAFNKEFGEVHPENDDSLHIPSAALSKQSSIPLVVFPHYVEVLVGFV